ncbi:MAG TPA: carbohydrate ABC transporter permease [Candidatus Enterenecus faecium]|uniref:Carbohydrate ABC transporter permease n=1 Tax=Candidatus Enterenecus faecium TaxID=2840780 RepID=A0A9D0YU61_9FIRM|nr:carbohydrate ABC transporter permease [Candidatus Enterenecus faecium]
MNRTTRIGGKSAATVITYACLIIGSVIMIFPFVWMILTALKSMSESVRIPPTFFPEVPYFENFQYALTSLPFGKLYINTALMVLGRVVCAIVFSSMAGYAFAKLHFKGKNLLFALVLIQMMMPSQIFVIPQYEMLSKVGMTESIFALIFPGLVSAFGTFFLRQAYMGIPDEIAEAAYLDGCNQWQAFYKVLFPLTGSAIAALTIFTAVFAYADLMWPLVVNTDINLMTLSSGLATLKGQFTTNYPVLMAGSLFAMVPMLVLYLIFQRQFIEGIALTGGK